MKPATILLVDEDQTRRDTVREMLASAGYAVVEAGNAARAVLLFSGAPFDLVLVNFTLPGNRELALLEHLYAHRATCKVIVLVGSIERSLLDVGSMTETSEHRRSRYEPDSLLRSVKVALSEVVPPSFGVQIVDAGEFIRGTPTGMLDMEASKRGLAQIALAGKSLLEYTVLIDLRGATSRLSTPDVYELASDLVIYGETFRRKTALITRVDGNVEQAKFFETVAMNGGWKVRAFTEFEEAVIWLSTTTDRAESAVV